MTRLLLTVLVAATALFANAKEIARAEIGHQFEMLKQGDVAQLKSRFTDRLKDRITAEKVQRARKDAKRYKLSDLVSSVIEGEYQGKKTIKVKMKNGRTLTTLVQEGNEWLSDTLWFK